MTHQAVPIVYGPSYCAAFAAELGEDTRHVMSHIHRCNGEHSEQGGLRIHSCGCSATFYFVEDAIELLLSKLREREAAHEITGIDSGVRQFIGRDGKRFTEPDTGQQPA